MESVAVLSGVCDRGCREIRLLAGTNKLGGGLENLGASGLLSEALIYEKRKGF